jgi:hypothetical protein
MSANYFKVGDEIVEKRGVRTIRVLAADDAHYGLALVSGMPWQTSRGERRTLRLPVATVHQNYALASRAQTPVKRPPKFDLNDTLQHIATGAVFVIENWKCKIDGGALEFRYDLREIGGGPGGLRVAGILEADVLRDFRFIDTAAARQMMLPPPGVRLVPKSQDADVGDALRYIAATGSPKKTEFEKLHGQVQKSICDSIGMTPEQINPPYRPHGECRHDLRPSTAVKGKTKWCAKCDHRE